MSCIFGCMMFFVSICMAQKSDTTNVNILHSNVGGGLVKGDTQLFRLVGDVQLEQNGTLMYCDSAYINQNANNVEAFGNVKIVQPGGTQVQSDYLRYIGNTKKAYLRGNVSLTDGKSNLWCEELYYDVGTKIGNYEQGGTLQTETTTVSSNAGTYDVKSKDARFKGEVYVTDPKFEVTSEDLGYNTQTKLVTFFAPSIVTSEKSILRTSNGTWDGQNEIAHFISRSSIVNDDQYIEGDKLDYNKKTGLGHAEGKVIVIDTTQKTTLYAGIADYNGKSKKMKAYIKPVMKQMNGNDSLFIRADTFFAAPVPKPIDSISQQKMAKIIKADPGKSRRQKKRDKNAGNTENMATVQLVEDTTMSGQNDSTIKRYFIGYHNVRIFSDSLQGKCDSIRYSQEDSTLRMMGSPVAWFRKGQVTGDTILAYMDSGKVKKIYIPNNALLISQSGPDKAQMYDQVQGKTLTAFLVNNAIDRAIVWPNAECIYYTKDEAGAYLGVDQAQSERMKVFFKKEGMDRILFEQEVKHTLSPLTKVNISEMKLSRFQWLDTLRPKKLSELFE